MDGIKKPVILGAGAARVSKDATAPFQIRKLAHTFSTFHMKSAGPVVGVPFKFLRYAVFARY